MDIKHYRHRRRFLKRTAGIGFGIWEFSGTFGTLNSGRTDVEYEDWYGRKLDRKMLNVFMKYA